jgi:hypothetical protein
MGCTIGLIIEQLARKVLSYVRGRLRKWNPIRANRNDRKKYGVHVGDPKCFMKGGETELKRLYEKRR